MKKFFILIVTFLVTACQTQPVNKPLTKEVECSVSFKNQHCSFISEETSIIVELKTKEINDAEKLLTGLQVLLNNQEHLLSVSEDITLFEHDIGYILLTDINFDGFPDLALSTSFGVANQYFDYWTYQPAHEKYEFIGNLPKLGLDKENNHLHSVIKINANEYKETSYSWHDGQLVPSN